MSARQEKDLLREEKIKTMLTGCPTIVKKYMTSTKKRMTSLSRLNYLRYIIDYTDFINSINVKIETAKPMDIDEYVEYTQYDKEGNENGVSIRNTKLAAVKSFYEFLEVNDIIEKNPCRNVKKLKDNREHEVTYLTPEEIKQVREHIVNYDNMWAKRNECIFVLGITTGLRVSAICNIDLSDINLKKHEIKVIEKGNKPRTVKLGTTVCEVIEDWMADREEKLNEKGKTSNALFINPRRERLSTNAVGDMLRQNTNFLDKKISPHKMRSTCGMNLYAQNKDIYMVQEHLGHKNIQNTMIYVKATEKQKQEAANLMDNLF